MSPTRRPRLSFAVLCLLAAGLAACASDPPTRFHTLQAATADVPASTAPQRLVDLGPIAVPAAVDQPQWVVRLPDGSLRVLEQERWVAPLRDDLRATVLAGLRDRHATGDARWTPPSTAPTWRVRLVVTRFETIAGQGSWLEAHWTAAPATGNGGFACAASLKDGAAADPLALAAAHRRTVALLTDRLGASLVAGACPSG